MLIAYAKRTVMTAALAALVLSGCGGESAQDRLAEEAIRAQARADGEDVDVEIDSRAGTMRVQTEEGTVEWSGGQGAQLPSGFPEDVPVMDGLSINMSQHASEDAQYTVIASTDRPVAEVAAFYKEQVPAAGWGDLEESQMNMGGMQMHNLQYSKDARMLMVNIVQQDGATQVTLVTGQK